MTQDDVTQVPEEETPEVESIQEVAEENLSTPPITDENSELESIKQALARQQADYENFKKRVERDRQDMMFFLRSDIILKILPRVDDLERIISSTPEEQRNTSFFQGIEAIYTTFVKDLEKMEVLPFSSKGQRVNPDMHEVMTQAPGEEGVILEEFVRWYMLWGRVLRHAKVVVWNGNI